MKFTLTISLFFLVLTSFAYASSVSITAGDDCESGFLTDSVEVQVDTESFSFSLDCQFNNSQAFQTQSGNSCTISSGMCSGFGDEGQIQVSCADGGYSTDTVACPTNP